MKTPVDVPGWPAVSKPVQLLVSGLNSADITFRVGEMPRRAEKYRAEDVRFGLASHIAFSRQGLRDYARHDGVEQGLRMAQKQFGCWVCVTDGEHGVTWLDNDQLAVVPALPVKSVESAVLALMQLRGM